VRNVRRVIFNKTGPNRQGELIAAACPATISMENRSRERRLTEVDLPVLKQHNEADPCTN
jgi:hypothetical protein